jgi:hypothetical protein
MSKLRSLTCEQTHSKQTIANTKVSAGTIDVTQWMLCMASSHWLPAVPAGAGALQDGCAHESQPEGGRNCA